MIASLLFICGRYIVQIECSRRSSPLMYIHVLYYFYLNIQAKGISEPFAFNDYRKKKIREKIEEDREDRVKPKYKLPSVNKELAKKILNDDSVCISRQTLVSFQMMQVINLGFVVVPLTPRARLSA